MAASIAYQMERILPKKCENSDYGKTYLDRLTKMRINRKLFDFSLHVDGELIQVHKLALAIASDYFAVMFEDDTPARHGETVRLQDVEVDAVKALIDYMYSGIITLTEENVKAVFSASDLFQIVWVKEECMQFLKDNMNPKNCFQVRKFADMHSCKDLLDVSDTYILDNLDELTVEENLQLLSFEEIKEFIKIWQHSVKPEDGAYTAAINWVKGDVEGRRVHLVEFMSQIRLHLVSSEFLTNHIVAEPLLSENQKCVKIIVEALTHQLRDARGQILRGGQRLHRATQQCNKEYIFLAGGTFDLVTGLKETKVYDISKKEHIRMGNMNDNRFWNSVVSLNNMVYSAGGYSGSALGTAELYNPVSKRWNYVAAMNNVRSCFGMCVCDSLIYAVGGWVTSTVEVYDPTVNEWFLLRNMPAIGNFNRTTAEEGSLYSLTRSDIYGKNKQYRFDPREGDWFHVREMKAKSEEYELVSCDRQLFAIGKNDCQRLDIRRNKWETMQCFANRRIHFSAVLSEKKIFVIGGEKNFKSPITSVECFSIVNNTWSTIDDRGLIHSRGGAVTLSKDFPFD